MRRMGGTSDIVYVAKGMILLGLTFCRRAIVCKSEGVQVELTKECMKMGGTSEMENHYCNAQGEVAITTAAYAWTSKLKEEGAHDFGIWQGISKYIRR